MLRRNFTHTKRLGCTTPVHVTFYPYVDLLPFEDYIFEREKGCIGHLSCMFVFRNLLSRVNLRLFLTTGVNVD